jgi:hypothetical protein
MNERRDLTLILLRPDGSNRTWLLTPGKRRWIVLLVVLPLVVVGLLSWLTLTHVERYQRLRERYDLLAGRELPMLTPRPAPADAVPGAVPPTVAGETTPAPDRPQPATTPVRTAPGASAPVSLENFSLTRQGSGNWRLYAELTKKEWGDAVLRGFYAVVVEDAEHPGAFVSLPELRIQNGRPLTPSAGESFAIRRFRPIEAELEVPEGFRPREVRFFIFDQNGEVLLDQVFPVGGIA